MKETKKCTGSILDRGGLATNINLPVDFFGTGPMVKIVRRRDRVQQTVFSSYFVDGHCKCKEKQ